MYWSDLSILLELFYQEKESSQFSSCVSLRKWEQGHLTALQLCLLLNFSEMHYLDQEISLNVQIVKI